MDCTQVRENLSAYIDEMLDKQITELMDQHLLTCKACRAELESMRSVIQELKDVGRLKAPQDFLETLEERLETQSFWTRVKEILLVPAQVKIPLEFATICVVGVLIFSVYTINSPQVQIPSTNKDFVREIITNKPVLHEEEPGFPVQESLSGTMAETSAYVEAAKQLPVELVLVLSDKASGNERSVVMDKEKRPAMTESSSMKKQELSSQTSRTLKTKGLGLMEDGDAQIPAQDTFEPREEKAVSDGVDEQASADGIDDFIHRIQDLIGLSGGRILSQQIDPENKKDLIILAELPAGQYSGFIDKAGDIGKLKEKPQPVESDQESSVLIRIRVIPAQ